MDLSKIKSASQVKAVMSKLSPLEKKGVLFLQALEQNGMGRLVKEYEKLFQEEDA